MNYQRGLPATQTLRRQMNRDKAPTAASVDCDTGAMEVEGVGYSVCHNGNPVASRGILGLPVRISEADLLVVCLLSIFATHDTISSVLMAQTFHKRANVHGGITAVYILFPNASYKVPVSSA